MATGLDATTTDTAHLPALVDQVEADTGRRPRRLLADAGYECDENLEQLEARGIDAYVATRRDRHSQAPPAVPRGRLRRPRPDASAWPASSATKRGRAEYARRKAIVEPVFGQLKEARGFRRFSLRGRARRARAGDHGRRLLIWKDLSRGWGRACSRSGPVDDGHPDIRGSAEP